MQRKIRKTKKGFVVRAKTDKTVVVEIERKFMHPRTKKFIRKKTRLLVHDEKNSCSAGDLVRIMETRPISKRKQWRVVEILRESVRTSDKVIDAEQEQLDYQKVPKQKPEIEHETGAEGEGQVQENGETGQVQENGETGEESDKENIEKV